MPLLALASKFTKTRAAAFTSLCIRNVLALNSSIAAFQQSRSQHCPWSIEAESLVKNISLILVCYDKIIIELKAVIELTDEHRAQVLNYLKVGSFELGLLVNFGHYPKFQYERIAKTRSKPESDEPISF